MRNAPPYSVIKLPAHTHIMIGGFTVKHPLSIIGRPGTIIEIANGNILVDFREFKHNNKKVEENHCQFIISEVSLIFKYDLR